jgi:hypothetical protein
MNYLKDWCDLDSEVVDVLFDYFGQDVTIDEIKNSHFRGVLIHQNNILRCWQLASDVIEHARRGVLPASM